MSAAPLARFHVSPRGTPPGRAITFAQKRSLHGGTFRQSVIFQSAPNAHNLSLPSLGSQKEKVADRTPTAI